MYTLLTIFSIITLYYGSRGLIKVYNNEEASFIEEVFVVVLIVVLMVTIPTLMIIFLP